MGYIIGSIFIFLGALFIFKKVAQNPMIGIRLPWTYIDKEIWYKVHSLTGLLLVIWGLLLILAGNNPTKIVFSVVVPVIPLVLIIVVYLLWLYHSKYGTFKISTVITEKPQILIRKKALMKQFKWEIIPLSLITATFLLTKFYYFQLPAKVPTHFGLSGIADSWGPKSSLYEFLWLMISLYFILVISNWYLCKFNIGGFGTKNYFFIYIIFKTLIMLLFTTVQLGTIYYAMGKILSLNTMIAIPCGLLGIGFIVVLIVFTKIKTTKQKDII